ncbi:MHYT domain-containing protein [Kitasatospora sp. NPDC101183]|uniref:MHYT domain-containing protein n=1 Tax=Kitasatospora sp. NPDC101183 TaxID=3364100 RepID=UPI003809290D
MHSHTAHIDGFHYGWINPVLSYLVAFTGAALGLRCTVRALSLPPRRRLGWLLLAAVEFGCGIWTMHFLAMMGFAVTGSAIVYSVPKTLASLALAIVVVGAGILYVGYRPRGWTTLLIGGTATGCGVAAMHYLGMAAMQVQGQVSYDTVIVIASIGIAVFAATAALWMTLNVTGFVASMIASLIAGVAVTAMHYTGMAAVSVRLDAATHGDGLPASEFIIPLAVAIMVVISVGGFVLTLSPNDTLTQAGVFAPAKARTTAGATAGATAATTAARAASRTGTHTGPRTGPAER